MAILKGIRHPITTGKKRFIQNIGLEFLKPTAVLIARLFNLIKVPTNVEPETFEEAIAKRNLTEEQIQKRKDDFLNQAIIYFCGGVFVLGYCLYLMYFGYLYSGFLYFIL
jgi:hypothetical protein